MFKLTQSPEFWAKVRVEVQTEEGRRSTGEFEVRFKRVKLQDLKAMTEKAFEDGDANNVLRGLVTDWRGMADEDGQPIPFSVEALDRAIDSGLGGPMMEGFREALPKARLKN